MMLFCKVLEQVDAHQRFGAQTDLKLAGPGMRIKRLRLCD
jgi:hypothetical protein